MFIESTPETIREAHRALAQYMESERRKRRDQSAPDSSGAFSHVEGDAQQGPDSPERVKAQAQEYAKARNQNLRPLRQIEEINENACEGRDSALAYLERRRRSVIRK